MQLAETTAIACSMPWAYRQRRASRTNRSQRIVTGTGDRRDRSVANGRSTNRI